MKIETILNKVLNLFARKATSAGIKKASRPVAGSGKAAAQVTPAERSLAKRDRETAKLARKAAKVTRRLGR